MPRTVFDDPSMVYDRLHTYTQHLHITVKENVILSGSETLQQSEPKKKKTEMHFYLSVVFIYKSPTLSIPESEQ